jgi:hypothetical protein
MNDAISFDSRPAGYLINDSISSRLMSPDVQYIKKFDRDGFELTRHLEVSVDAYKRKKKKAFCYRKTTCFGTAYIRFQSYTGVAIKCG